MTILAQYKSNSNVSSFKIKRLGPGLTCVRLLEKVICPFQSKHNWRCIDSESVSEEITVFEYFTYNAVCKFYNKEVMPTSSPFQFIGYFLGWGINYSASNTTNFDSVKTETCGSLAECKELASRSLNYLLYLIYAGDALYLHDSVHWLVLNHVDHVLQATKKIESNFEFDNDTSFRYADSQGLSFKNPVHLVIMSFPKFVNIFTQ